ncbi:MAG: hypothetical protein JW910_04340, partial [Anaerolineae bacterium]|nr:hypothetical protein [Anaerolineae bacterium]
MPHRRYLPVVLLVLIALAMSVPLLSSPARAQSDDPQPSTTFEMWAALNAWRLEQDLAPFAYNPALEAMARLQVEYLLAQPNLPENLHDGLLEENP